NIFKAFYNQSVEIDIDLESQLMQAYDCLRLPLLEQIQSGRLDSEQALTIAEPIFTQIEERLGDALTQGNNYIPSSSELGVNMALSIFEVDVGQGLEHLATVLANPTDYEVAGELRAQAEVFAGFGALLELPGFGKIAEVAIAALDAHPERAVEITQLALANFQAGREAVLAGDSTQGGSLSADLLALSPSQGAGEARGDEETRETFPMPNSQGIEELLESIAIESEADTAQDKKLEETVTSPTEDLVGSTVIDSLADIDLSASSEIIDGELIDQNLSMVEETLLEDIPSLDEMFGNVVQLDSVDANATLSENSNIVEESSDNTEISETGDLSALVPIISTSSTLQQQDLEPVEVPEEPETLEVAVQSIEQLFEDLPAIQDISEVVNSSAAASKITSQEAKITQGDFNQLAGNTSDKQPNTNRPYSESVPTRLTVRVDSERLETMNNLAGELAINRNSLSLQNEQLQTSVQELLSRFARFGKLVSNLRGLSDQMLVDTSSSGSIVSNAGFSSVVSSQSLGLKNNVNELPSKDNGQLTIDTSYFDSLELDSYGTLHSQLQGLMEEMMQLEEAVDDIALFAGQSVQTLEQQQQMLSQLRDEVMWARMLPLSEVLNRFPRVLRSLSTKYRKSVNLKLSGTGVLVDKGVLEKLYDPLLHLIRNAFDHGIEAPDIRHQLGKPEAGQIQLTAYHKGNSTIIEVTDDGQGIRAEQIRQRALEREWFAAEQLDGMKETDLFELIFEPGFSTAAQVTELSGRGVGLDVVRSQLRSLKGNVTVTSSPNQGTTFILKLPLTLTIAKLMVCLVSDHGIALPSDSIEEIVIPKANQIKQSRAQRFLLWQQKLVPIYQVADLLEYGCPSPNNSPSRMLAAVPSPANWALPILVMTLGQEAFALEVESLVTEQELVIKPFGTAIAAPDYTYGCTILGDGSLIPVIDGAALVEPHLGGNLGGIVSRTGFSSSGGKAKTRDNSRGIANPTQPTTTTVLVVDDAAALRRTLALTLEKAGFRVVQARDGREAIEQLQKNSSIGLVICDIEMPNMNGFDFLNYRRQDPELREIPVAMLTSRSNEKHRWLALHLGATAYFTKPYIEQDFLAAIQDIISSH
ncbi:MAG: hybrid sensor histidine kinase/response regulator, partial [Symploca sp. SIO1A3]|nr:hybrid sensor histidine kinase/response regulator [Symploca sp. SIO1A3]